MSTILNSLYGVNAEVLTGMKNRRIYRRQQCNIGHMCREIVLLQYRLGLCN